MPIPPAQGSHLDLVPNGQVRWHVIVNMVLNGHVDQGFLVVVADLQRDSKNIRVFWEIRFWVNDSTKLHSWR